MTRFVDPRVRMRNALRALVQGEPERWHEPSLLVFRNRLLDETGSDARPLAELLLEALQRGWRERLPSERVEPARWDALSAPFVMQWSAERFVQPDMAQWATESWALAFGVITPEQLRVAVPVPPRPPRVAASHAGAPSSASTPANATGKVATSGGLRVGHGAPRPTARTSAASSRAPRLVGGRYVPSTFASMSQPNPKLVWSLAGSAVFMYLFFLGRMYVTVRANKRADVAALAAAPPAVPATTSATVPGTTTALARDPALGLADTAASASGPARVTAPVAAPASVPVTAPARAPASAAALGYTTVISAPATEGTERSAPPPVDARNPGVPSVTRGLLDGQIADPNRMLYVRPAQRAQGNSRPVPTAAAPSSMAYDELVLNDGSAMRGRVEIVRAGTVIFRDLTTGLRHEVRKDDIDRIITEFGTPVRFRVAGAGAAPTPNAATKATTKVTTTRRESGPRDNGVAGAYLIRYSAAVAVGSKECTDIWRRTPNSTDRATVRHMPGADTLRVDFDGGDTFLSNMDAQGYFASTFRIVPDQARTSTALTTRLTGQFKTDGSLALQVIIVFYRRMREGRDLTCTVTVNASGTRS